jgi:hypothetical protein
LTKVRFVASIERLKLFGPCLALLVFGFAGLAAPQILPSDGERVAVFAPGADALGIVATADGEALAATTTGMIAISAEPGFVGRLYHSGAWLVLRFDGLLGCLISNSEDSDNERG